MKAPDQRFDYDVATYVVSEQYARDLYPDYYAGPRWWGYDPWGGFGHRVGAGLWLRSGSFYGYPRGWRRW
jgi:hypothetical protein